MRPQVTAIVVARGTAPGIDGALAAIAAGERAPEAVVVLHPVGRRPEASAGLLPVEYRPIAGGLPTAIGVIAAAAPDPEQHWLWLLRDDDRPEPAALAALLAAAERSPSVVLAGPKALGAGVPPRLRQFGITMTPAGRLLPAVPAEPEQGQYDARSDVLAVGLHGMLARVDVWRRLDGIDPALPAPDAALDLGLRARLAGHRVVTVPAARVEVGDPWSALQHDRRYGALAARRGQLHRGLAWSSGWALPWRWLSLPLLAVLRSVVLLLGKRPGAIPAQFAALAVMLDAAGIGRSRRRLAAARRQPWTAIEPLLRSRAEQTRLRAIEREQERALRRGSIEPLGFFTRGGLLTVLAATGAGVAVLAPLLGARHAAGGALLPLGGLGELWRTAGLRLEPGPVADPFHAVLAAIGALVPWAPSLGVLAVLFAALPLAAAGAWLLAAGLTPRPMVRAFAGIAWALAPMLLTALGTGRLGAVLTHLALPWLLLAVHRAPRSWTATGAAALLFLVVVGGSPSLLPALGLGLAALCVIRARSLLRFVLIPIPAALLAGPLLLEQLARLQPLALLADPGRPLAAAAAPAWQLALGFPEAGLGGWQSWFADSAQPVLLAALVVAVLLLPLAVPALIALFRQGLGRTTIALALALLGLLTAVAAGQLSVVRLGLDPVPIWPGGGLSLYWLGLLGAAVLGLAAVRGLLRPLLAALGAAGAVLPLFAALGAGAMPLQRDRVELPAIVAAEARTQPGIGTIVIVPEADGGIRTGLVRGSGDTLESFRTAALTGPVDADRRALAQLAVDLIAGNAAAAEPVVQRLGIGYAFVTAPQGAPQGTLLPAGEIGESAVTIARRAANALDSSGDYHRVSETELGIVWRLGGVGEAATAPQAPRALHALWFALQLGALGLAALAALPVRIRKEVGHDEP